MLGAMEHSVICCFFHFHHIQMYQKWPSDPRRPYRKQ